MIPRWGLLPAFLLFFAVPAQAGMVLRQSDGSELVMDTPPRRIITLAPNLTEMLFAAGAGHLLVATVEYSNFPEAAAKLPRIGDAFRFDLERLIAFQPDLVIGWTSGNPAAALDRLQSLGLNLWRVELRSPQDIVVLLEEIGRLAGTAQQGQEATARARAKLNTLTTQYQDKSPVSYFYQVAERPLFTLNGEHIISQGLEYCGGHNVFGSEPVLAPQVSIEAVLVADPAVFIAPAVAQEPDPLQHWRDWPRLQAVQNNAMIYLPADQISQATVRMLDSLALACKLLDDFRNNSLASEDN